MLKKYYMLTKPGIVYGNAITGAAGFFLASKGHFDFFLFGASLLGLSFVVAAGCVLNNYFDRFSDQKMARTKFRSLAVGTIPLINAVLFGITLLSLGLLTLSLFTTFLATFLAASGFVIYVGFYTVWKHRTVYATEVGSIAGAVPSVVGYTAVSGQFDLAAFILFSIIILWQMPHFFAISIYRLEEYASASIPVLPIKKGISATKVRMVFYLCGFFIAAFSLNFFGYVGYIYLILASFLSCYWIWAFMQKSNTDKRWARKVFLSSIVVILGLCTSIALDQFFFLIFGLIK